MTSANHRSASVSSWMWISALAQLYVEDFPEARKPAWKLTIDFGPDIGVKKSSAQITDLYDAVSLRGRQVMAVVNFPPRQIGPFISEVLTLGLSDADGAIVLLTPERPVPMAHRCID
ncbi:MAG: tRNA-binding protein [Alphaproteobacteria bacterium]|nr:MAG: tRNA-binding protein [Alphaproteobacteria bacterium]